ncbi:hypothetical protein RUM43_006619 [Polyplax serrata]|uniref:phospholipase A2 n=1 Tax=Polyplax serrata TaxID=468196 RepID=A0AAN8P1J9_POLSC
MEVPVPFYFFIAVFVSLTTAKECGLMCSIRKRTLYREPTKDVPGPEKNYTGIRLRYDSLLIIYYHEQTVAIVEVSETRELFNCELLEVRYLLLEIMRNYLTPSSSTEYEVTENPSNKTKKLSFDGECHRTEQDRKAALESLRPAIPNQNKIRFHDMLDLMAQCHKLEPPSSTHHNGFVKEEIKEVTGILRGIFPGTKWCGAGDIAGSYHDLGPDTQLDKCCRSHDLCPVKVAGFRTQYNATNYSLYTKTHCDCDDIFYDCLKALHTTRANILGDIYFNVARFMCVEDIPPELVTTSTKKFVYRGKKY